MNTPTVVDFFCGAGGFSEGFSQANFKVIKGIDNWAPAITTHNINHSLQDEPMSVLDFEDIDIINQLPDSDIIIGSPPCVSFSLSNKGGNADKSLGIRLIEAYLRVVAVKKHQPNSILKAWLMENVPNSKNYVKPYYTFRDLNLAEWATNLGINPDDTALNASSEGSVLVASDYGAAQARSRYVCGEITETGKFPMPALATKALTVGDLRKALPAPLLTPQEGDVIVDPNYPHVSIPAPMVTDHHYDTGVYEVEWQKAKLLKTNHPYMGKMSFPENEAKPSRTIMATRSASTREAIIYRSEIDRKGNGEYRLPTIREAASIMGFPLTYVFYGNEANKWRQVGNAVCPQMSYSLANSIRGALNVGIVKKPLVKLVSPVSDAVKSLDDFKVRSFDKPPQKSKSALFRAHPVKSGNMTVALTNKNTAMDIGKWNTCAFTGTGKGYRCVTITAAHQAEAERLLQDTSPLFLDFIATDPSITSTDDAILSQRNESYHYSDITGEHPLSIVNKIGEYIHNALNGTGDQVIDASNSVLGEIKHTIPLSQIMSIYALGLIVSK